MVPKRLKNQYEVQKVSPLEFYCYILKINVRIAKPSLIKYDHRKKEYEIKPP